MKAERLLPALTIAGLLVAWEAVVRLGHIPHYTLPAPSLVAQTLWDNFPSLASSWWFTLRITFGALVLAAVGGVAIAAVFALSRKVETALFPVAIVLQVTPVVAIAPLILIYVESTTAALLAWWAARSLAVVFVTHNVYEAVYLSQRVLVMSSRPGRVVADIAVEQPYPRIPAFRASPAYLDACSRVSTALETA
jgi:ABC-type nitrate/sulfonate/bicarbonate transport system permease component